jgi:DNA-binding NtrC family response regulator
LIDSVSALVVDDLADGRRILGERLEEAGFEVFYAVDGMDALRVFLSVEPDLVVTDARMPRLDGTGLVRRLREISDVPVVVMTAYGSIPDCEEALRVGADRYFELRRGLEQIGDVARELVGRTSSADDGITATRVRRLAQDELRASLRMNLIECRGNIAEMARRMGRDRSTIRYHLRRMGMLGSDRNRI